MTKRKITSDEYDYDYFENGLATGKSLYNGYNYDPIVTPRDVLTIKNFVNLERGNSVLDFGAAKGIHIKVFREMGYDAWGCDISKYAISSAEKSIRPYLKLNNDCNIPFHREFDCIIFKDVLEHLLVSQVNSVLSYASKICKKLFAAIPLGDGGKFVVPDYNKDVTHILPRTKEWWLMKISSEGFNIIKSKNILPGIKNQWGKYKNGDLFVYAKNSKLKIG